jgi:hypothetical protein
MANETTVVRADSGVSGGKIPARKTSLTTALNNWGTDEAQEERYESTKLMTEQRQHPRGKTRELDNKTLQLKSFDERCTTLIAFLEAPQHDIDSGGDGSSERLDFALLGSTEFETWKKGRHLAATAETTRKTRTMSTLTQVKALTPIVEAEFGTFSQAQQQKDAFASWNSQTAAEVEYCRMCAMPPGKSGQAYLASLPESCKVMDQNGRFAGIDFAKLGEAPLEELESIEAVTGARKKFQSVKSGHSTDPRPAVHHLPSSKTPTSTPAEPEADPAWAGAREKIRRSVDEH